MSFNNRPIAKRKIGFFGLCSIAVAGSAPMIFILGSIFSTQGTAAIVLMLVCVINSALAVPGFIELVLMYPQKEGGISGVLTEAYRPYNPIISNLAGTFYWWSWFEGSSFAATTVATMLKQLFPTITMSVPMIATLIILACLIISFRGMGTVTRLLIPFALGSLTLGLMSMFIPMATGHVDWVLAFQSSLKTTFGGLFGSYTSIMAGIFFLAYAVPAYETVLVYVSETKDPAKTVPRAMYFGTALTLLYYVIFPTIWLGVIGVNPMSEAVTPIGSTYQPIFGEWGNVLAGLFFLCTALITCFEALNNSPRVLSQIAKDGMIPEFFSWTTKRDVPWLSILITAVAAIVVVWFNAPAWFLAAVSFEYVLLLVFASVGVWLLRKDQPDAPRLYRAPRGWIGMGLVASAVWILSTIFGFQQFGLSTMIAGIAFAFTGIFLYFWRKISDRSKLNLPLVPKSLHVKLSGTLVSVLLLDAVGYLIAVSYIASENTALIVVLEDIFVVVALLTLTIGFILPGMIASAAAEISAASQKLVSGTLHDFSKAMEALGNGNIEDAHANISITPVKIHSNDEIGEMAHHFNLMQDEIKFAALGLDNAREGLKKARDDLNKVNRELEQRVIDRTKKLADANTALTETLENLKETQAKLVESERLASLGVLVTGIAHEVNTPLGISITASSYLKEKLQDLKSKTPQTQGSDALEEFIKLSEETAKIIDLNLHRVSELVTSFKQTSIDHTSETFREINLHDYLNEVLLALDLLMKQHKFKLVITCPKNITVETYPGIIFQTLTTLVNNSIIHGYDNNPGGHADLHVIDEGNSVKMIYRDYGKGIPQELQKKIFEPFYTTLRNKGGVGLGLFITYNKFSQLMKGSIFSESPKEGHGAVFVMEFQKILTPMTTS